MNSYPALRLARSRPLSAALTAAAVASALFLLAQLATHREIFTPNAPLPASAAPAATAAPTARPVLAPDAQPTIGTGEAQPLVPSIPAPAASTDPKRLPVASTPPNQATQAPVGSPTSGSGLVERADPNDGISGGSAPAQQTAPSPFPKPRG